MTRTLIGIEAGLRAAVRDNPLEPQILIQRRRDRVDLILVERDPSLLREFLHPIANILQGKLGCDMTVAHEDGEVAHAFKGKEGGDSFFGLVIFSVVESL